MDKPKKVFIFMVCASGHTNPITSVASELVKKGVDVTFYSTEQFRPLIEKSGATFRAYSYYPIDFRTVPSLKESRNLMLKLFYGLAKIGYYCLPELIEHVDRDQPDLILFDKPNFHVMLLDKYLHNRYEKNPNLKPPPKFAEISTVFAFLAKIYPTQEQLNAMLERDNDIFALYYIFLMFLFHILSCLKYGIRIFSPFKLLEVEYSTVFVTVFPEFQPRKDSFPKRYKFTGCCVNEAVRNYEINDQKFKEIFESFKPVNPLSSVEARPQSKQRLIYASLGTVFNDNGPIFEKLIEAINSCQDRMKDFDIKVIISLGQPTYKQFQERIKRGELCISDNFSLLPFVPQLEVLKRASLFITHCGMNSSSESIHYGVPLICVPLSADQPVVAERLSDELKLGKKFDPFKFQVDEMSQAIEDVLSNDDYLKRMIEFSKLSRKCDGVKNMSEEIINLLNKKDE